MNGWLIVYLSFWVVVVVGYVILNYAYKAFLKLRAKLAKWILINIYHEYWRKYED